MYRHGRVRVDENWGDFKNANNELIIRLWRKLALFLYASYWIPEISYV